MKYVAFSDDEADFLYGMTATAVGATINIPETAVFFSGGGFSDYVHLKFHHCMIIN